jgi:predicted RNA methylase
MEITTIQGENYSRQINTISLRPASPIFWNVGSTLDVSNTGLSNKILDYIFDKIEFGVLSGKLKYDDYLILIVALKTFQMNYVDILRDFRSIIKFKGHEFGAIVYLLLDNNIDPILSRNDLKFLPIENKFAKFIIDASKNTYLDYSYFSTAGELSRYSSLMPWHLTSVRDVILKEIPNVRQITDLTAHIGVDSVNFSVVLPNVNVISIEIDPQVFLLLRDNLLRYCIINKRNSSTLRAYNSDATQALSHPLVINSDVVYVDPPWGGLDYVQQETVKLMLGEMKIEDVVRQLLNNGVRTVILKGPGNLYTEELLTISNNIHRYEIKTKPQGGKLSYLLFVIRL